MPSESADQTTTLHIAIGGLCLLVRDETQRMLHVLFPRSGHGAHHHPVLMVHPDFRVADDMDPNAPIWLDGVNLALPAAIKGQVAGEITGTTLFPHIVAENCFRGRPVPRALWKNVPNGLVKAMITITAGQQGLRKGEGVVWDLGNCTDQKMGTWVHWQIPGLPSGDIELQFGAKTLRLRPQNGEIELVFLHEPKLPPNPLRLSALPTTHDAPKKRKAPHFAAFFDLIGAPADHPVPAHGDPREREEHEHAPGAEPDERRGLDYTCIMATAPAEPPNP